MVGGMTAGWDRGDFSLLEKAPAFPCFRLFYKIRGYQGRPRIALSGWDSVVQRQLMPTTMTGWNNA